MYVKYNDVENRLNFNDQITELSRRHHSSIPLQRVVSHTDITTHNNCFDFLNTFSDLNDKMVWQILQNGRK